MAPGLHIYDEPVPEGMVATRIEVSGPPGLISGDVVKMPTRPLRLPGPDAELPGRMPGAIITTMDSRKYMMRMVARGLLRSPVKGARHLKESIQHLRAGPMGRRPRS